MGIIHVLDTEISNKIAAGEVVERPASVVKELVENSIDAGATTITVELRNGGVTYIRVSDNGKGMSEEDAKICFLRHATSKIKTDNDLDAIYTLGFRGEALSSIGAVARVSLYTKQKDEGGICITCCGGEILSSAEAGIPDGTSVIVESLFYNTPARLKFLKKDATEAGYISDIMTRFIFAHPEISFRLIVNGKDKLFSPGDNNLKNAVYTAYGKDYAKGMLDVCYSANGIRVTGLVGKGNICRPNRNYQSFFVNRRYIKSAMIFRAVDDAYKNQIMIGKFPVAVLNIEIDPQMMDINVHPTKLEVKFANEKDVRNAVYYGVKNALYALPNIPEIQRVDEETGEVIFERDMPEEQLDLTQLFDKLPDKVKNMQDDHKHTSNNKDSYEKTVYPSDKKSVDYVIKEKHTTKLEKREFSKINNDAANLTSTLPKSSSKSANSPIPVSKKYEFIKKLGNGEFKFNDVTAKEELEREKGAPVVLPEVSRVVTTVSGENGQQYISNSSPKKNIFLDEYFRVIGQIFETYIIVEKDDKMLMIDQHAAHERLKYEELKKEIASKQVMSQMLIEPVIVKLTAEEFAAFEEFQQTLYDMGFECDVFGADKVIVRGVPGDLEAEEAEDLLVALITNCTEAKHSINTEEHDRMLYTIACKAAIKANHRLTEAEMDSLVRNVFRLKNINTCPHGRPIVITMSKKEIEKEFKRIV